MAEDNEIAPKQRRTGYEAFRLANLGQSGGTMIGGRKGSGGKMRFNRSVAGTRDPGRAEERLRQQYAGMSDADRAGWESRANDGDIRSGREMEAAADYEAKKTALLMPQKLGEPVEMMETPAAPAAPARTPRTLAQGAAMSETGQSYAAKAGMAMRTRRDDGTSVTALPAPKPTRGTINGVSTNVALGREKEWTPPPTQSESIAAETRKRATALAAGTIKPRTQQQIAATGVQPMTALPQTGGTTKRQRPDFSPEAVASRQAANTAKFKAELDAEAAGKTAPNLESMWEKGWVQPSGKTRPAPAVRVAGDPSRRYPGTRKQQTTIAAR